MLKDDALLHKWVNNSLSPEELETFKSRPNYDSLERLRKETDKMFAPPFDEEAILQEVLETRKAPFSEKEQKGITHSLFIIAKYAAAAAVLLGVVWFVWPASTEVVLKLANAEKIEGYLPDESTFALNAGSTLRYDKETWNEDRTLNLEGEAYFKVKEGSKFTVKTKNGSVQVLGTQFNVWSRNGILEVKCKSGKVAVLSSGGVLLDELEFNDAVRVENQKITEEWRFIGQNEADWVAGITRFKKVPLKVVLEELERQFDVKILSEKVNVDEVISCNFQQNDLKLALMTALGPLDILFEMRGDKVVYLYK